MKSLMAALILGLFFAVGFGMLLGSCFTFLHTRQFLQNAVETSGEVVGWDPDPHRYNTYERRIRFQTTDGRKIDFVGDTMKNPPCSWYAERSVSVLYDPQNPEKASINSFTSLWLLPILLVILGVFSMTPGFLFLVSRIVGNRKSASTRVGFDVE
jgi:hypothetical protein